MEWKEWKKYYEIIRKKLEISETSDERSARLLNKLLKGRVNVKLIEKKLEDLIRNRNVFIYGCGPSLKSSLSILKNIGIEATNIAADGAISGLISFKMHCHINCSDLDGNIEDIIRANEDGTITIIHAHGDNMHLIEKYTPMFRGQILGSVQTRAFENLINYGGFTDGDRCVFLAAKFKARKIVLFGFDFGEEVGEYSKPGLGIHPAGRNKIIKLRFAEFLISEIIKKTGVEIYSCPGGPKILGLKKVSFNGLKGLLGMV
ncbi:MAG: 6-hydroxymethylpterin diphosphokinase MptE-like protein [Candidatus Helarchaeota archaeon]